jgi:hypothetical protein
MGGFLVGECPRISTFLKINGSQRTITLHSLKIMRVLTIDLHHRWILNFILVFCHWHLPHIQLDPTPSLTMFYNEWNAIIQSKHTEEKSFDIKYRIYKIPTWASYFSQFLCVFFGRGGNFILELLLIVVDNNKY